MGEERGADELFAGGAASAVSWALASAWAAALLAATAACCAAAALAAMAFLAAGVFFAMVREEERRTGRFFLTL